MYPSNREISYTLTGGIIFKTEKKCFRKERLVPYVEINQVMTSWIPPRPGTQRKTWNKLAWIPMTTEHLCFIDVLGQVKS